MNKDVRVAVQHQLGVAQDNLWRAKAAFRNYSAEGMQGLHGESGQTRAQILADYESEVKRWEQALSDIG
jgi:hypothetical protein